MAIKNNIISRLWIVFLLFTGLAMAVIVRAGIVIGNAKGYSSYQTLTKIDTINGMRGDILSENGHLLSTSLPEFSAYLDLNVPSLSEKEFNENVDTLAYCLSQMFTQTSQHDFKHFLVSTRKAKNRYKLLRKNLTFSQVKKIKVFPLFKKGRNKGGLIIEQENKRQQPFGLLAQRTIGYTKNNKKYVGIEGAFNEYLEGDERPIPKYLGPGSKWIPVIDAAGAPERGRDVKTTINIHLQDIAEEALKKALVKNKANHGCAIVMEVETGKVKAIANLKKAKEGYQYHESYNYAIGESTEPGSTFKLASILSLLKDGKADMNSIVYVGNGQRKFYDRLMKDSSKPKNDYYTLKQVLQHSSNVGIASFVDSIYGKQPEKFITNLRDLGLLQNTKIELAGEVEPTVLHPHTDAWSGVSLPWLSIGYGIRITPLQQLAFYNAVANNGKYMQPYLVEAILENGKISQSFNPKYTKRVCNEAAANLVTDALVAAVNSGTAKGIKFENLNIAGKTGTAQIANKTKGYEKKIYQASFAGFFPAENPKYSCIIVINEPTNGQYYGSSVAAPVFKEIVQKFYVHRQNKTQPIEQTLLAENKPFPKCKVGSTNDLVNLLAEFDVQYSKRATGNYAIAMPEGDKLVVSNRIVRKNVVPNVRGMGLADAFYLLENKGIQVKFKGDGKVYKQSIKAGARITRGQTIYLELS